MGAPIANWLKRQSRDVKQHLRLAIGLGTLGGLLLILQAWSLAQVVHGVVFNNQSLAGVMPWLWLMLALLLIRAGLSYAGELAAFKAAAEVKQELRSRLLQQMQELGPLWLQSEGSGDLATTLTDSIEALENYYARYLPAMSLAAFIPLSILAFVFPMDWRSALVMSLTAPLIPWFMILIGKGAERLNQRQWQKLARMGGHFLDVIQGLTTLKLFNASRREAEVIGQISEDYRHATMKVLRLAFLSALALEFFSTISIAIVAVLIGFRLLFGEMDFLTGFFILLLAPEFYLPLRSLGTHYHARMDAIGASERMVELLDTPISKVELSAISKIPESPLHIRFEDVHFSYEKGRTALAGADFEIWAGERVALVGPSGAGKSSIINMLLGFITPQLGEVRINGFDLKQLDPEQWRRQLAWMPQRPRLFHGSVAENVGLGLNSLDQEMIIEALRRSHALEFVEQLPDGIHTVVGEGGRPLSGGQTQRLALARIFLRDARLVILDEPTANLDRESEHLIQQAIDELAGGRSLLSVAHRLQTVEKADRILVMNQGRLVEEGDHAQLIANEGLYKSLIDAHWSTA
jgi:ATP-binding cassette subfamily C protein CydD